MLRRMEERDEVEIRIALEEGLLSPEEASALRAEARRAGRSPLALIQERGGLSEETLASIRGELALTRDPEQPATLAPRPPEQPGMLAPSSSANASALDPAMPAWGRYQC